MTVKLLSAWGAQPAGTLFTGTAGTEAAMITAKVATADLTGGITWVPPGSSPGVGTGSGNAANAITFVDTAGAIDLFAGPTKVVGFNANGSLPASIIPRQNTLSNLQSIINGGGEIAVATDTNALVILKNGTPVSFAAIPATAIQYFLPGNDVGSVTGLLLPVLRADEVRATRFLSYASGALQFEVIPDAAGIVGGMLFRVGNTSILGNGPGSMDFEAGSGTNPTEGYGGEIYITAGGGKGAGTNGAIYLRGKDLNGANHTSITLGAIGSAPGLSFYDVPTPVVKPTVTGSRGGNAALASLLTALATLGLINNSSSA